MTAFNLNNQNVLTFARLDSANVTAFDIHVEETMPDGTISKYILITIPNPKHADPIHHIEELQYAKSLIYNLSEDIYYSYDYLVTVLVNGNQLTPLQYTYDEQLNLLTINLTDIKDTDVIEMGYYKDEIQYIHSTINKCIYYVQPVIDYTHNMGDHNILL